SCSKIEQKQLNTWVSFQSAEQPLLGQFSVSGNMMRNLRVLVCFMLFLYTVSRRISTPLQGSLRDPRSRPRAKPRGFSRRW
ncbi:MAG: hypothetical protein B7X51_14635, partial [Pseudomonas sp. 34-62-33]